MAGEGKLRSVNLTPNMLQILGKYPRNEERKFCTGAKLYSERVVTHHLLLKLLQ